MDNRIFSIGVTILLVGIFLIFAFWPITSISARDLAEESEDGYEDYDVGEKVTVYGTITDINQLGSLIFVELDGDFIFLIDGQDDIDFSEGDLIYCEVVRSELIEGFDDMGNIGFWELEGELKSKRLVDYVFYVFTGIGIAIAAYGAAKT